MSGGQNITDHGFKGVEEGILAEHEPRPSSDGHSSFFPKESVETRSTTSQIVSRPGVGRETFMSIAISVFQRVSGLS